MLHCEPLTTCINVGEGKVLLGRLRINAGSYVTQDDLASITYQVTRSGTVTGSGSLTISQVIHDTLQTDAVRWKKDKIGYNFEWDAPAALFPTEGVYHVSVTVTPTGSGSPSISKWEVVARAI